MTLSRGTPQADWLLVEVTEIIKLAELEDRHWWYHERRVLLRELIADLYPEMVPGRVALDIGAAAGGNTRVLRDLGFTAVPLEFDIEGATLARQRGLPSLRADARRLPFGCDVAEVAVAFDILEHVDDHAAVLTEIHRVLRPGGHLLVAVPADMDLWSAHDEAVGHLRRYSREGLRHVTEAAGFHIDDIWSWNVLMRNLTAVRRRRATGSQLEEHSRVVNATLRWAMAGERRLPLLRRRRGVSLFMTATRPSHSAG